jgi:hypothetical protein
MTESDSGNTSQEGLDDKVFWDDFYYHVDMLKEVGIIVNQESLLNMPDEERKEEALRVLGHTIFDEKPSEEAITTVGAAIRFLDQHNFFPKGGDDDALEREDT